MKTSSKALIYDGQCPVCSGYSQVFVKTGILQKEGRVSFSELHEQEYIQRIDPERARCEIPLVDLNRGETLYGIDSLIFLLSARLPILGKIMKVSLIYKTAKWLYTIISFNRRIFIPVEKRQDRFDCSPPHNSKQRFLFLGFALFFSVFITYLFGRSLGYYLHVNGAGWKMILIAGTGWGLQLLCAFSLLRRKETREDYAAHLGVIMIIGVLLLLPSILLSGLTGYRYFLIPAISVALSSAFMLIMHIRRSRVLGLSQVWTLVWFLSLQSTAAFWSWLFCFKNFSL